MRRPLVLVGLSGSGKSAVGRLAAESLGAPLFDIDNLLVRQMGCSVAQMFGMLGEPKFRQMERDAVLAAITGPPGIIVPGGGWAAQPGQLEAVRPSAIIIYLKCDPAAAARRMDQGEVRPLLASGDPVERLRAQLQVREPYYRLADYVVETDRSPVESVAAAVAELARRHGGWHQ